MITEAGCLFPIMEVIMYFLLFLYLRIMSLKILHVFVCTFYLPRENRTVGLYVESDCQMNWKLNVCI